MKKAVDLMESHLRLGEILLNLGRIEEARIELSLAKDIANKAPDAALVEQTLELEKLHDALDYVDDQSVKMHRLGQKIWMALFGVATILAVGFFSAWIMSRAAILELRNNENAQDDVLANAVTLVAERADALVVQSTAAASQLEARDSEMKAMAFELTQSVQMVTRSAETLHQIVTLAAEKPTRETNLQAADQTIIIVATPTPRTTSTAAIATSQVSQAVTPAASTAARAIDPNHQLRITEFRANFRAGPGFGYRVQEMLNQDSIVTALAYSHDYYWYYIESSTGDRGWVHSSLAKPASLVDELPIVRQ